MRNIKIDDIFSSLATEQSNNNTWDIDTNSTIEILDKISMEDQKVALLVKEQIPNIAKLIDASYESIQNGGRIIYVGAGTSGRLGILDASECPPTYGVSSELVQGVIAGGIDAMFKAKEGIEDSKDSGKNDLISRNLTSLDMVIGIAASGRTPYVMGALEYANKIGAQTGSVCCVNNSIISKYSKYPIEVETGAEVITGSTRMKAGTAQKLILNMISTSIMIKYGKVFHNYMVDIQPTNEKLEIRAKKIIEILCKVNKINAEKLFILSGKHVKTAIVMGLSKVNKVTANHALQSAHGNIVKAVQLLKEDS